MTVLKDDTIWRLRQDQKGFAARRNESMKMARRFRTDGRLDEARIEVRYARENHRKWRGVRNALRELTRHLGLRGTLVVLPADHPQNEARRPIRGRVTDITDDGRAVAITADAAQDLYFADGGRWFDNTRIEVIVEAR